MKWFFDGTVERGAALRSRAAASGRWGKFSLRYTGGLLLMDENPRVQIERKNDTQREKSTAALVSRTDVLSLCSLLIRMLFCRRYQLL